MENCHDRTNDVHTFTYLNLIGDGIHNFTDGLVIAVSFMANIRLGIVTSLAVILHEIPPEIGDFGILVKEKNLKNYMNVVSSLLIFLRKKVFLISSYNEIY